MTTVGNYSRDGCGTGPKRPPAGTFRGQRRNSAAHGPFTTMIGIPVTAAAYEAIRGPLMGQRGSPPLRGRDGVPDLA
jgi:hypothetical protein